MHRYCGKSWSSDDIERIRTLIEASANATRAELSRRVCEIFGWRSLNGKIKQMSCRVVMLRMQRDGLISLPAPKWKRPVPYRVVDTPETDPAFEIVCEVVELTKLRIEPVARGPMLRRWNEFVGRYHYLGYKMLPGAQIRYFIMDGERVLGAMGFGAAAWKVDAREQWIGWNHEQREKGLHLIVGQSRFLILPWVHCQNLASKSLAMAAHRLPRDWEERYGFRPVLLETFVDTTRFQGTCYRAANWVNVGHTKGRGKLDRFHSNSQSIKRVFLKPLSQDWHHRLKSGV